MEIHEKIKQARVSAGLNQDEIAEKIGIKRSTYQYWEENTPSLDKIKKVAKALNLSVDYFIDENFGKANEVKEDPVRYAPTTNREEQLLKIIHNLSESGIKLAAGVESAGEAAKINAVNFQTMLGKLDIKPSSSKAEEKNHVFSRQLQPLFEKMAEAGVPGLWKDVDKGKEILGKLALAIPQKMKL